MCCFSLGSLSATVFDQYARPLYAPSDLAEDAAMGFRVVTAMEVEAAGVTGLVEGVRARVGGAPVYASVDIDLPDPSHAHGTGTPEGGGLTSRELLGILRGMSGIPIVSADVVEVSPPYDHAELTSIVASHSAYELIALMAGNP
jgi:guanidinobutyrase / D-arginase